MTEPNFGVLPRIVQHEMRKFYMEGWELSDRVKTIMNNDLQATLIWWPPENFGAVLEISEWLTRHPSFRSKYEEWKLNRLQEKIIIKDLNGLEQ